MILPELHRDGALLRGRCPIHDEKTASFTVFPDGHYHCFGCGAHGWMSDLNGQLRTKRAQVCKPRHYPELDWTPMREAFTFAHAKRLANWRGYSPAFCKSLAAIGLVGIFEDQFCFPVWHEGKITRAHVCMDERMVVRRSRRYMMYPSEGSPISALVHRSICSASPARLFESQWDMFAAMEQLASGLFIATRGACNAAKLAGVSSVPSLRFLYPQNDEAGELWLRGVIAMLPAGDNRVIRVPIVKDLNDFTKAGGRIKDIQ